MYSVYRYAYAEMLQMWGQPLARLEIMKFNVFKETRSNAAAGFGTGDNSYHELHANSPNQTYTPHDPTATTPRQVQARRASLSGPGRNFFRHFLTPVEASTSLESAACTRPAT